MTHRALKGYRSIQAAGKVEGASPHALIALLFEAALAAIQAARRTDDASARHRSIDRALAIVGELQGTLHEPETDSLSAQLHSLYSFVQGQLLAANRDSGTAKLQQAHDTLLPLHEAWRAIGPMVTASPNTNGVRGLGAGDAPRAGAPG